MPLEEWTKLWMYILLGCLVVLSSPAGTARPRFDTSTDMGLVLVPADAEIDSVIFRLRATDQDADFPLIFDITATVTPIVRIENLPCTLYNKVCQANVILTRRLVPGRLHDFAVRVKDSKGDSNSMQATISVTNATTQRDKIFPHIPAIIMVPEDSKPGKELDYVLVRSNQWSGKPVYIELWQPKELFTIRQRQTPAETRGVITLTGELDFETQSMYTLTMYATDPYTEPKKDTRNIAGLQLVVIVQDVQDVPPIFTLAPPLTKINNTIQPGDLILRVHAEDGDKGVPREVTYGLVSEGNPFTPFFNISETTGEITLARSLEELTQITHVGAPVVLSVVAEEIRRSTSEPPAQATVVEVGLLLGEPGNSPPFFENENYVAWMDENSEPGSVLTFTEHYSTKVRDEDIGKAGVFALKLYNNNGTFEISPAVAERVANFIITVRDNSLIDYEMYKSLRFEIIAQEVGPATNLSTTVPATIFIRDVNDNAPEFDSPTYEVTLSEDVSAGTRIVQVHATDKDTGSFGRIQYTRIIGPGNEGFVMDPNTGIITVAMENSVLDREITPSLQLSVEARDEDGKGLRGIVPLIVNLLDVNDNAPTFEKENYEFTLNEDSTNFTVPAIIKAFDADAEPPNNEIRYELVHGNYENKFYLNEMTGEIFLREPINKIRRTRQNPYQKFAAKVRNDIAKVQRTNENMVPSSSAEPKVILSSDNSTSVTDDRTENVASGSKETLLLIRKKRENDDVIFKLTARAYDLGVPHLSGVTRINVMKGPVAGARIVSFVVPGDNPDPVKTAETLAAITGGPVTVQEIRPYTIKDVPNGSGNKEPSLDGEKKSIVVARVEPNNGGTSLVDIERIRAALAANGVGVIGGGMPGMETEMETKSMDGGTTGQKTNTNTNTNTITNITSVHSEEVTIYKAENRLLFWLLIILGLLMLLALIALIICCICPGCPFYMAPRKRRVHSSETLIARSDGRPKRHLHRKHARLLEASWPGRKQAWSADPMRRNWQFNRRNQKAGGLASLPGDVHAIDRDHEILERNASLRLRDGPATMYSTTEQLRRPEEERIYIEDVEGIRARGYVDMDSFRQHDPERGLEIPHQAYVSQNEERAREQSKFIREQHFYRDGNTEILRLITRGQAEEGTMGYPAKRPQTLVLEQGQLGGYRNDGKEILLQRFIEDQKHRHATIGQDLHDSFQDIEHRSMESHQRQKNVIDSQPMQQQSKILLLPERLEEDHRRHIEELGPEVQRLIIDHGRVDKTARLETKDSQELVQTAAVTVHPQITKVTSEKSNEQTSKQNLNSQHYSIHDLELARQNALLTRLLLGRDGREVGGGGLIDSASYLETQSLPGQVAIATQTDRTAATQTELPNRSRSDNDESEEEARIRKKLKSKKRYTDAEPRRIRTLWMKSPIEEEEMQYGTEKRTIFLRKKIRDVKENRRISLDSDVLREISDSLDENGDPPITVRRRKEPEDFKSREESRNKEENERLEESSSMELVLRGEKREVTEKKEAKDLTDEDSKRKNHRGKRESIVVPSFRILEKEMSSLSKKLSRIAGKKILQYSNGSETDSHETVKLSATTNAKKTDKKAEMVEMKKSTKETDSATKAKRSKSIPRTRVLETPSNREQTKIREEIVDGKTRQTLKYRKGQNISTGSSDFDETMEKLKKSTPLVTHNERQRQAPLKSSYVKSKKHSRLDLAKSALVAHPHETGETRDTSDTASKESMKSCKSEKSSMKIKTYSTETVERQFGTASGSASSDSFKDKRSQRKEKPMLENNSVVETAEVKTALVYSNGSPSSDNFKYKRSKSKERPILDRKRAVDRSEENTESEQPSDGPTSDSLKSKTPMKKASLILDRESVVEAGEGKTESEQGRNGSSSDNLKDKTVQSKERLILDRKSGAETNERKTDSEQASDSQKSENSEDQTAQRKARPPLDKKSFLDHSEEEAVSKTNTEDLNTNNLKDSSPQKVERPPLDRKSAVEDNEEKTESKAASNDKQDICQRNERPILEKQNSVKTSEILNKVSQEEISRVSPRKSNEKSLLEATVTEIERKSPELPEFELSVIPVKLEMEKGEIKENQHERVLEASVEQKIDDSKIEPIDTIEKEVLTVPKEEILDFLSHEVQDSMQSLQGHYQSITEGAEKIKDIVIGSVTMENVDEKSPCMTDEERTSEPLQLGSSDHIEGWSKFPNETSKTVEEIDKQEKVAQQSEDGGMFSDNFCSVDVNLKDSLDSQGPNNEISYETMQSESSEEQAPVDKTTYMNDEMDNSEKVANKETPEEKLASPQIITIEETLEPQKSVTTTPIPAKSTDSSFNNSPKKAPSCSPTPVPYELLTPKKKMGITPDDSIQKSEIKLETDITIQELIDAPKDTMEPAKSPEIEQSDIISVEAQLDEVPIVPPLEIKILDESIVPIDKKSTEETLKMTSPKLPSHNSEKITLESPQKEFGIADSLFVDAKILPSSPKNLLSETNVEVPQEEVLRKEENRIDIPPINLVELSRVMLEDADDSDSSETSSKTMLTARPYGTPRHRPIMESGDMIPTEVPSVSIETTPVTRDTRDPLQSPEKIGKEALSGEHTEQILIKPDLQIITKADTIGQIDEEKITSKDDPRTQVLTVESSSETSKKEPQIPIQVHDEDIKKVVIAAQQEDAKEDTTEKVQLNQICQKTLPAVPDGFASLPETDSPMKTDTTLPEETPLSDGMKKLQEEIKEVGVEEQVIKASETDAAGIVSLSKTDELKKTLDDTTLPKETLPLSDESKKFPVKISAENVDKHAVKAIDDGAKVAPHTKKVTKGIIKKRDVSKENLPSGARKVIAHPPMKTSSPTKERKGKTLKDESTKLAKQTTVMSQLARSRDFKQQVRPAEPQTEEQANLLSRPDRIRRTWRKTERADDDIHQKEKTKVEIMKKKSKEGSEKSVDKRPMEISAKRKKLKGSRAKKIQENDGKLENTKIIPVHKVERVSQVEKIHEQETIKDSYFKDQDGKGTEASDHSTKEEMLPIIKPEESMAPVPVATSEKLVEDDEKETEEKLSLETSVLSPQNTEFIGDTRLDSSCSKKRTVEIEKAEHLPINNQKQDSATMDEKIVSALVSQPVKQIEESVASEIIPGAMTDLTSKHQEIELESTDHQPETKKEAKQETEKDKRRDSIEDKSLNTITTTEKTPTPQKAGKSRREPETAVIESQSRYMEWYKLKREEMERKRQDRKDGDEEEVRPKWLRKSTRQRWIKVSPEDRKHFDPQMTKTTPSRRRKIKPLVNVESEQLKAIVRQGRKLRRAQGENPDEPQVQIFAPEKPPTPLCSIPTNSRYHHHHHLVQHSEYKYEKMPSTSFYLHPPPVPNTTPRTSPQNFDDLCPEQRYSSFPMDPRCPNEIYGSGIVHQQQQIGNKLRHGELLEKKSVFDIAYSEAAPSQLRSDSTTPPS